MRLMFVIFMYASSALAADAWDVSNVPGDSREIPIDVSEGTWMNLDVSPDGRTIVFDLLGDIYTLPIEGGEGTAITSGLSWDMQARFSPDGKLVAFTSDRDGANNIWIMQPDGSGLRQVTHETFRLVNDASWSADGRFIAARKHFTTGRSLGTGEIWMYHLAGGDGIPVIERPNENHQKELGEPAFSNDGRFLYFSQDTTPGAVFQYAQDSNGEIFTLQQHDLQTRETKMIVSGAGGAVRPTPSPNGRYLAFVRRVRAKSALFLKDLVSGEEKLLYGTLDQDLQEVWAVHGVYPSMAWLPDSKSVIFWAGGHIRAVNIETMQSHEIPFHIADTRTIVTPVRPKIDVAPDTVTVKMIRDAEVSPNGKDVVFEAAGKLYIKRLPNGDVRELTHDANSNFEFQPSWSRDGRRIVFVSWDDDSLGEIRTVPARGGRSTRLTKQPGHYRNPGFSPDGMRVVFEQATGGFLRSPRWSMRTGIFSISVGGGQAKLVSKTGRHPHFGVGSDRVFVTRGAGSGFELLSMDLAGGNERVHATSDTVSIFQVSPDERYLGFREGFHIYLMPMPIGGKSLMVSSTSTSVATVKLSGNGGDYPHWSQDGTSLNWTLGPRLYQADVVAAINSAKDDTDLVEAPKSAAEGIAIVVILPADKPSSTIALRGARIVTMDGSENSVIENGVIVLQKNRITAVGPESAVVIPADATVIGLEGRTIIPGLIDAHAHAPQGAEITPQQNWANFATLAFGVTTIHDPGNISAEIFPASEMQRLGRILAPRIFSAGNVLYGAQLTDFYAAIDSAEDANEHVRRLKAQGAHSIKNYNQPRREQRQQIAAAAREEGMLLVAEGASILDLDLALIADGNAGIEHNLPQSMLYDDVTQYWSQTEVSYTPTLVVSFGGLSAEQFWYQESDVWRHPILSNFVPPHILQPRSVRRQMAPFSDYHYLQSATMAKLMADHGVTVNVGGHGQREGLASHWEMWSLVQGGMSPREALQAATLNVATHLGLEADIGSLQVGKLADLVVLTDNPLDDIRNSDNVELVILNGRVYDAASLDERISGSRKTKPFYWQQ